MKMRIQNEAAWGKLSQQITDRDDNKPKRNDNRVYRANKFNCRHIFAVIQTQSLERTLECMVQVKTEYHHKEDIQGRVGRVLKQQACHGIKVMVIGNAFGSSNPAMFNEVKITQVNCQEYENDDSGMNHIL